MRTLGELLRATPPTTDEWAPSIRPSNCAEKPRFPNDSIHDEQIQGLVQQLFFKLEPGSVKSVGFAPADASTKAESLCLETARALAAQGYDVALVEADPEGVPLQ